MSVEEPNRVLTCDSEETDSETPVIKEIHNKLTPELKSQLSSIPGALELVEYLKKTLKYHKKKYKRLKLQLKRLSSSSSVKSVETQTDLSDFSKEYDSSHCDGDDTKIISTEEVTKIAELATQSSGFIYEESSGMYYDCNTGYYYNAEYGLYYDGNTGTYMKYDQESNTYEFHSQVATVAQQQTEQCKRKHKKKAKTKVRTNSSDDDVDKLTTSLNKMQIKSLRTLASEITKQWPPCMRIIVDETLVPSIKTGSLYIITCDGGSLGREGAHSIIIPDINISKHHLKFNFDQENGKYFVVDLGSRNGSILNGKRMASSKQESDPLEIVHGSKIQVGSTVLLCHIHEGTQTCGHCEPGLVQQQIIENESNTVKQIKSNKQERHKDELQQLRKKYGVNCDETSRDPVSKGYRDRAQLRREVVGSQNPYEKTQMATLDESISSKNKGFKLLEKMGWKEGQSLGKEGQGLSEPVALVSNQGNAGIGYATGDIATIDLAQPLLAKKNNKDNIWKKAQERFENLTEYSEKFED